MPTNQDSDQSFQAKYGPLGLQNYRRQLGRSEELGDPVAAGDKLRVVLVQSGATGHGDVRAYGDAASSSMTVTCSYRSQNAANDARPLQIQGVIEWGCDGHQCAARFDWHNGTTVHIGGSFVRVVAEVVDNIANGETEPSHDPEAIVTVGAFLAYYRSAGESPTLTQQALLEAGVTSVIEIPAFARSLTMYGPLLSSAQWLLGADPALAFAAVDPIGLSSSNSYVRPGPATHIALASDLAGLRTLVWGLTL